MGPWFLDSVMLSPALMPLHKLLLFLGMFSPIRIPSFFLGNFLLPFRDKCRCPFPKGAFWDLQDCVPSCTLKALGSTNYNY